MDLLHPKKFLSGMLWLIAVIGLILAGCQFIVPQQEWNKKWGPLVPHTHFPGDCSICHIPERWDKLREDFSFDHEKETGYRLEGVHKAAACLRCHNDRGPVQAYASRGCAGCHMDPHAATLGTDCLSCHDQRSWEPTGLIGEHARTRFPLMGSHAIATCESCHEGAAAGQFQGAPTQCEVCHKDQLALATDPNHIANGWVADCQKCHQPTGWQGAFVNHDFFPLAGGHAALNCSDCHTVPGVFTGLSQDCYTCHSADFQTAPAHEANNYSHDCTQCHTITDFTSATFDHSFFPLTGKHTSVDCTQCHVGGVYAGLSQECSACHSADYQTAPNHVAGNYPMSCEQCHTTAGWQPASFDHSAFPLTAGHAGLGCAECHSGGVYTGLSQDCYSCHSANYQTAPNHLAGNYPKNCEQCHTTTAWTPAAFDHSFFSLTGGHSGLDCSQCHAEGVYTGLSQDCYSCHAANYQTAPDHLALNFDHDCTQCHSISAWSPSSFTHTAFSLTGGHNGLTCSQCHKGGTLSGLTSDCYSCHSTDYQTAPNHVTGKYPLTCEQCHNVNDWSQATFDHSFFPLTEGHSGVDCSQCHSSGVYAGLATDCYSCHASDYQGAPDHAALGFPHDCEQCHSISGWTPSSFQHNFPLKGDHNVSCITCHDSGSTQVFTCFNCHEHSKTKMDDEHSEVNGYSYNSQACYSCHPNGKE